MTPLHVDAYPVRLPTPSLDLSSVVRSFEVLGEAFRRFIDAGLDALAGLSSPFRRAIERARTAANEPAAVAGLESRYAVRAGLDPAFASPEALDGLVGLIMRGDAARAGDRQLRLLTPESRSLVAAAAIRGWCYSHGDGPAILAWHRLIGTQALVVTRG